MRHGRVDESDANNCKCYRTIPSPLPANPDNRYNMYNVAIDKTHMCTWSDCTHSYDNGVTTTNAGSDIYVCPVDKNLCRNYIPGHNYG